MNQTSENGKKNMILGPIFACLAQIWAPKTLFVAPLPDLRHCCSLSFYAISRKTLMIQTQENGEKPHFGPDLGQLCLKSGCQFFFQKPGFVSH